MYRLEFEHPTYRMRGERCNRLCHRAVIYHLIHISKTCHVKHHNCLFHSTSTLEMLLNINKNNSIHSRFAQKRKDKSYVWYSLSDGFPFLVHVPCLNQRRHMFTSNFLTNLQSLLTIPFFSFVNRKIKLNIKVK